MHSFINWAVLLILSIAFLSARATAQESTDLGPESTWQGTMDLGSTSLRIQFKFKRDDGGKFTGDLVSLDQGNAVIPLDSVEITDQKLKLACTRLHLEFAGEFDRAFTKLSGTLTQGIDFPLELVRVEAPKNLQHVETWNGTLKAAAREFDFQIRVFHDDQGNRQGKLDSFSEKLGDLGLEFTNSDDSSFDFKLPITKATYAGKYNAERNQIDGKWKQGGSEFDLSFAKVELSETRTVTPPKRPQNPEKPYPYREVEVKYENAADKVTLSGTLTLPKDKGKYPAAILISGSGGQDRDESLLEHKPFLVLSDHLTRAGYAVLRFDDRGIGKSTGDHAAADSRDFARDVAAGIEFLKQHEEIDPKRIGMIGHSEGGLIAPIVATSRDDVAFVVMLAGPGVTGKEIVLNQTALIEKAEGAAAELSAINREFLIATFDQIESGKSSDEIKASLRTRFDELRAKLPKEQQAEMSNAAFDTTIAPLMSPWFRYFLTYDPRPTLAKLRCPVLALNGELDLQVDPKLNLPEIKTALAASGNSDIKIVELPGLNHLFQSAKTGSPTEYRAIEETMSPTALDTVTEWLNQRFK